ncbi:MAG TPA: hypothetical protein VHO00_08140, partial [Actinomycetes bacterium]|nr:hypothetical protein [Actinomycetes bacterium]
SSRNTSSRVAPRTCRPRSASRSASAASTSDGDRVAIVDRGRLLQLGAPAELIRGLDSPVRISIESGLLTAPEAKALAADAEVTDDGVSLTIATRSPSEVLAALADRDALRGLQVRGATLEDVFLELTGREYRE